MRQKTAPGGEPGRRLWAAPAGELDGGARVRAWAEAWLPLQLVSDWTQQIEGVGTFTETARRLARGWKERGLGRRGGGTGGAERGAEVVAAALNK